MVAAVAAPFGRDLDEAYARIGRILVQARAAGVQYLALPEACLGGYLSALGGRTGEAGPEPVAGQSLPPALDVDGPELRVVRDLAGDMVISLGICESDAGTRYNSAVTLTGDGILHVHRKVHQPLGENLSYARGEVFRAFDSPIGRMGTMICYDKAFPEAARTLALDGAQLIGCLSAWPGARTAGAADLAQDRWKMRADLFDRARALENQVFWVSANQTGTFGSLRFVGSAKVVGPGGDVLADTGVQEGLAVATVDLAGGLEAARRAMFHLQDRRPETYRLVDDLVGS